MLTGAKSVGREIMTTARVFPAVQITDLDIVGPATRRLDREGTEIGVFRLQGLDRDDFCAPAPQSPFDFILIARRPALKCGRPFGHFGRVTSRFLARRTHATRRSLGHASSFFRQTGSQPDARVRAVSNCSPDTRFPRGYRPHPIASISRTSSGVATSRPAARAMSATRATSSAFEGRPISS